jgi:hypothetical protein
MATKNEPIAEPYAGRALLTMQQRREKEWPDMRFFIASYYKVGKQNEAPQYQMILESKAQQGVEAVVLAFGNGEKSTSYCKAEDAHLYVGPTSVLMGEPMKQWREAQQTEFRHVEQRIKDGLGVSLSPQHKSEVTQGDLVDAGTYSKTGSSVDELS